MGRNDSILWCLRRKRPKAARRRASQYLPSQKWMMMSLAAMTAQFLVGAIPALALPLNAG